MNPTRAEDARRIITAYKKVAAKSQHVSIVACPPFVYLPIVSSSRNRTKNSAGVAIGAQNVFFESEGSFTGEVSPKMLRDLGVSYVIIGHSERRKLGETDEIISKKTIAALSAGLCPIVCIGEAIRDVDGVYLESLKEQIKRSLSGVPRSASSKIIIAYEPIWAIGAKEAMKATDIHETALFIKKVIADIFGRETGLDLSVLYGGSVNWRNASDIISVGGVQGFLVGRESINVPGFIELATVVNAA